MGDTDSPVIALGPSAEGLPRCLHVTGDFPDPFDPHKTPVIRALIDLTVDHFAHKVVSLNRRSPDPVQMVKSVAAQRVRVVQRDFPYGTAVRYDAPPLGLFHARSLDALGIWLGRKVMGTSPPDLLVGHKLTIEGIMVERAARVHGTPYAITIQGNTDCKILAARPDLRRRFAHVFHGAQTVFCLTPWALDRIERALGKRGGDTRLLPCPTDLDQPVPPRPGDGSLLSVFHLANWRSKNLAAIADASARLDRAGLGMPIEIVGGGNSDAIAGAHRAAAPSIRFAGALDRSALAARLNAASGFVLPSRRESFGLVFIEALFAGLPIIYPAGAAIDGYFDEAPFALRVDARDPGAIASAMQRLIAEEAELKAALASWQTSAAADRFRRPAIAAQFSGGLAAAALGASNR